MFKEKDPDPNRNTAVCGTSFETASHGGHFVTVISGDGDRIVVYHPGGAKGRGVPVSNSPPPIPQGK
jgi:hypothetical protein